MKVCGPLGIEVIVLDRPNPIGGHLVEGCGVEPGYEKFCGLFALPQRHINGREHSPLSKRLVLSVR